MQNKTNRVLIETIVRKALKDIQDDPERNTRNLVDMALQFSKGRFQKYFFQVAQKMLQNESSPYYGLMRDAARHIDHERLLTFGMNIGYNGCTLGAKRIREIEAAEGFNIPWAITLHMPTSLAEKRLMDYQQFIDQGEALGTHVWFLFAKDSPEDLLPLVKAHPDSAFVIFLENVSECFFDEASEHNNFMLALRCGEDATGRFMQLRERKLLYAVYELYNDETATEILSGDTVQTMQQLAPISIFIAEPGCQAETKKRVYQYVDQARADQLHRTILWEYTLDNRFVDTVISGDACLAGFTSEGDLYTQNEIMHGRETNLHETELSAILKRAFPKERR